jgi:polysaccharide export outer membrane protein
MRALLASVAAFAAALLLVAGSGAGSPARAQEYSIGEGDLLRITVYDNPDLTTEVRVSGDGKISFPLIGDVTVSGRTVAQAQEAIAALLREGFIKKPEISVFIKEYKSKKVTALGEFNKPGLIEMRGNATLMEVISDAGGVTQNAGDVLVIKRKVLKPDSTQQEDQTISVQLNTFLEGRETGENPIVVDGDSIYVPRAAFVYVSGAVKTPGVYKLTRGLTVLKAITLAGGFTQRAAKSKVKVIRKAGAGEESVSVRMEDLLLAEDVITVPESLF